MKTNSIYLCFADLIDGPTYVSIEDCVKHGFPQDIKGDQLNLLSDDVFIKEKDEYIKLIHPRWLEVWSNCCVLYYEHARDSIHQLLTNEQKLSLVKLAERQHYAKEVIMIHLVSDGTLMVKSLGGMTLGIEPDGYTHS